MAHRSSAAAVMLNKTSSIFDVELQKAMKAAPTGQSTTSFTYEPIHPDDKMAAQRRAVYEPTYRLGPRSHFKPQAVKNIIDTVLEEQLRDRVYKPEEAGGQCKVISTEIQKRVKRLRFDRYKFVVNVMIGQRLGQSVDISSRCCWDKDNDSMASSYYESPSLYAVAIVFGIYFE